MEVKSKMFDLTAALKDRSHGDKEFGEVIRSLRRLESVNSRHIDLTESLEFLKIAKLLISPKDHDIRNDWIDDVRKISDGYSLIVESLINQSIMMYCRAVHSASHIRNKFDIIGQLTEEQKKAHLEITDLRDRGLAHYGGFEDRKGKRWVRDHIVLEIKPQSVHIRYPKMRKGHDVGMVSALEDLIQVGITYFDKLAWDEQSKLAELVFEYREKYPDFRKLIASNVFSPKDFFGFDVTPGEAGRTAT